MKYKVIVFLLVLTITFLIVKDQLKLWLLNLLIVQRGILASNCFWYKVSDLVLDDGAGVNLYNNLKEKYGDFIPVYIFSTQKYIVTNNKYIKTILDNSPNLFNVGIIKQTFFKSFMEKNVGVSSGCPWKQRRYINEMALVTDKLHIYSEKYNNDMVRQLMNWKYKRTLEYNDFYRLGKRMVAKIIFNSDTIDDNVFNIFSKANSLEAFFNPNFKIDKKITNPYFRVLKHYLNNPNKNSLIELCLRASDNKEEVLHQIPHFMFPIVGLFVTTIPRLLLLLSNHKLIFKKVIQEIYSLDNYSINHHQEIYKLSLLRKCILETLRLNNPVISVFRRLEKDYTFDHKYHFKKGTQFLILNNPVLRETEYFREPDKFIPSRWTPEMEKSYYAISFNQGPQRCPGKELAIYLVQSFIYNFIKIKEIATKYDIVTATIDTGTISQILNPCSIRFHFVPYK